MSTLCSFKDLAVYGTSNQTCTVTEDFEIGDVIEDTGLENIESVECDNCGESFGDLDTAKEHIEEQAPKEHSK